ncbi:MAG: hypothetical protein OXG97_07945 [Candidatus Poribacteria bacterium]|nr:hypothetical protein [Candidatus Poribacteria bacterium]
MKRIVILSFFSLLLLYTSAGSIFAAAPTVPKIAFTSVRDGNREIYIMNPDGSEQVNLTQHDAGDLEPVWSPAGEEILFVSDRDGIRDLYLMNADGSNVQRVFKKSARREQPTWAPDGKQIAYSRGTVGNKIIHIATLEKQTEEPLASGYDPAWSPDGTEIAFVGGVFGRHRLSLINVHTRRQKRILPEKVIPRQHHPSWSPTGEKLAFSWNNNPLPIPPDLMQGEIFKVPIAWHDTETIYVVNRDGTNVQQIVDEDGPQATNPAWAPQADEVLYTQMIDRRLQIFKIDVTSHIRVQLTHIGDILQANVGGDWFDPATLPVPLESQLLSTTWGEMKRKNSR